jgi:predicted nucleic acid-binding protein
MQPLLILDTSVLIAALRSSSGASHALLRLVGQGHFSIGVTAALVLEYEADLEYLEARAVRGSRVAFERVLGKVPATAPLPGDER